MKKKLTESIGKIFSKHYQQLKELSENLQICPVALYLHFSILVYVLQTLKLWHGNQFSKIRKV